MRCPECNKFVSYGEPEMETGYEGTNGDDLRVEVRLALTCAECGTELKELDFEFQLDIRAEIDELVVPEEDSSVEEGERFELQGDVQVEFVIDVDKTYYDKRKKRRVESKSPRAWTTLYGVRIRALVRDRVAGKVFSVEKEESVPASEFSEL